MEGREKGARGRMGNEEGVVEEEAFSVVLVVGHLSLGQVVVAVQGILTILRCTFRIFTTPPSPHQSLIVLMSYTEIIQPLAYSGHTPWRWLDTR